MLNLEGRRCLLVGGGGVTARRVPGLLEASAAVTIISPALHPDLEALDAAGQIMVLRRPYTAGDVANLHPALVFAATDSAEVNQQVAEEARQINIWVSMADDAAAGDFDVPAVTRRGPITLALSTGAPALTAHLRPLLEAAVGEEYVLLAGWMADARADVRASFETQGERAALWRSVLESPILEKLRAGQADTAKAIFDQLVNGKTIE
jgi:precorrin-2 dehydrogenase/sirohydrochlorin ferrochelatase